MNGICCRYTVIKEGIRVLPLRQQSVEVPEGRIVKMSPSVAGHAEVVVTLASTVGVTDPPIV